LNSFTAESFHTVLYCRNWDACVSFYRDILELEEVDTRPGFVEVRVAPGSRIGLIRRPGGRDAATCDPAVLLSFRVADVDKIHAILSARWEEVSGVKPHPWGARLFELRDPDGRRLEFWTPQ
jgi:catechol 2,3-dioxygenase-like lactoylglutathione lyase family enzyme